MFLFLSVAGMQQMYSFLTRRISLGILCGFEPVPFELS